MNKIFFIYILSLTALFGLSLTSCVDEVFEEEDSSGSLYQSDGETIALTISLQSMTRAGEVKSESEAYEDFIDPSKIILLFIYAEEDEENASVKKYDTVIRQYAGSQLSMIPIQNVTSGDVLDFYVKLPILDEADGFADVLRNHDFKVAALVNWSNKKYDDIKDAEIKDGEIVTPGSSLSILHHLETDDTYADDAFKFLIQDGKMGVTQSWVKSEFSNSGDTDKNASVWIRQNCTPGYVYTPNDKYPENYYENLRYVWNFNGAYNYYKQGYNPSDDYGDYNASVWAKKNYDDFNSWLTSPENGKLKALEKQPDNDNFSYTDATAELYTGSDKIGVKIPEGSYDAEATNSTQIAVFHNAFIFDFSSSGSLNIKWGRPSGSNATLKIQRIHNNGKDLNDGYDLAGPEQEYPVDNKNKKIDLKVTGDSEAMAIYAVGGEAVIYEIEYVKDQYLYETYRTGIEVSKSNPIGMYGIQQYTKLEKYWKKGMLFNLSDFNNLSRLEEQYPDYQKISLLRSVAKVELRIPKTFKEHNVILRCVNRRARLEPVDVSTSTNDVWQSHIENSDNAEQECEWFRIIQDTKNSINHPFYYAGNSDTYQNRLAWYYGSWAEDGKINEVSVPNASVNGYPKILNPRIERSDFTRFIKVGDSEGIYTKYILYVPEKFVDDPNNKGRLGDSPKVCHIEFRRGEMNGSKADPQDNLDDNNCYRIYFTENGFYSNGGNNKYPTFGKQADGKTDDNWEESYEKNVDNLRHHWPIMRNHVYSFTVEDTDQKILVLNLEVLPWKEVKQINYNW